MMQVRLLFAYRLIFNRKKINTATLSIVINITSKIKTIKIELPAHYIKIKNCSYIKITIRMGHQRKCDNIKIGNAVPVYRYNNNM